MYLTYHLPTLWRIRPPYSYSLIHNYTASFCFVLFFVFCVFFVLQIFLCGLRLRSSTQRTATPVKTCALHYIFPRLILISTTAVTMKISPWNYSSMMFLMDLPSIKETVGGAASPWNVRSSVVFGWRQKKIFQESSDLISLHNVQHLGK